MSNEEYFSRNENCPTIFQANRYKIEGTGTKDYFEEEKFENAFEKICVRTLTNYFARLL